MTGYGTGGTFHGAGKYIKEQSPNTKIVLAEPAAANLIGSGIKTERNPDGSPATSHSAFAGKSALVLFYYVYSDVQSRSRLIWALCLNLVCLYITAFKPQILTKVISPLFHLHKS